MNKNVIMWQSKKSYIYFINSIWTWKQACYMKCRQRVLNLLRKMGIAILFVIINMDKYFAMVAEHIVLYEWAKQIFINIIGVITQNETWGSNLIMNFTISKWHVQFKVKARFKNNLEWNRIWCNFLQLLNNANQTLFRIAIRTTSSGFGHFQLVEVKCLF